MKYKTLLFFISLFSYNAFCTENIQLIKKFSNSNYFDDWDYSIFPHNLEGDFGKKQLQNSIDKMDANLSKTWIAKEDFHNNILSCRLKNNISSQDGNIVFVTSKNNCLTNQNIQPHI